MTDSKQTYELVAIVRGGTVALIGIKCQLCLRTSYNLNDVHNLYCGNCHIFHTHKETT